MKQLGFFIIFSLIFHFLASTTVLYYAEKYRSGLDATKVTQIEILEEKPEDRLKSQIEKTKQLVKQLKNTVKLINNSKKEARFESETTQRVEQETRATNLGLSRNSAPEKFEQQGDTPEFMKSKGADSAVSNILPQDIRSSNATNLNTDANIYYSFYNRVEELFYLRWVERVRQHWDRIGYDYKKNVLAGKTWSTTVEILLTAQGEYHSARVLQSSGQNFFDESPVFAFKQAKFFPNPPKAKVEPDGFIRLKYRFNVNVFE